MKCSPIVQRSHDAPSVWDRFPSVGAFQYFTKLYFWRRDIYLGNILSNLLKYWNKNHLRSWHQRRNSGVGDAVAKLIVRAVLSLCGRAPTWDVICLKSTPYSDMCALGLPPANVGVPFLKHKSYSFHLARLLEWCGHEHASFCHAGPGRLAVFLQVVQEGWNCLVYASPVIRIWPIHTSWRMISSTSLCILTVRHIFSLFDRRDVVKSVECHRDFILTF